MSQPPTRISRLLSVKLWNPKWILSSETIGSQPQQDKTVTSKEPTSRDKQPASFGKIGSQSTTPPVKLSRQGAVLQTTSQNNSEEEDQVVPHSGTQSEAEECSDVDSDLTDPDALDMEEFDELFAEEISSFVDELLDPAGRLDAVAFARAVLDAAGLDVPFARSSQTSSRGNW